jgi:hypothetical protein
MGGRRRRRFDDARARDGRPARTRRPRRTSEFKLTSRKEHLLMLILANLFPLSRSPTCTSLPGSRASSSFRRVRRLSRACARSRIRLPAAASASASRAVPRASRAARALLALRMRRLRPAQDPITAATGRRTRSAGRSRSARRRVVSGSTGSSARASSACALTQRPLCFLPAAWLIPLFLARPPQLRQERMNRLSPPSADPHQSSFF